MTSNFFRIFGVNVCAKKICEKKCVLFRIFGANMRLGKNTLEIQKS